MIKKTKSWAEKFVYTHSDLAASSLLGMNSKEGHGTSHCNVIANKSSVDSSTRLWFKLERYLSLWQCSYLLQCAKCMYTSCTPLSEREPAKNIQWRLSVLRGECPICLAVITDAGMERADYSTDRPSYNTVLQHQTHPFGHRWLCRPYAGRWSHFHWSNSLQTSACWSDTR